MKVKFGRYPSSMNYLALLAGLTWPARCANIFLLSLCIIPEPTLSQTPTLPPMSTNKMNIRDDGVYWYFWVCYAIHPSSRRIPFWVHSLVTDIRSSGTTASRSPLLFFTHMVSGLTLNINEIKPRRDRSQLFIISILLNSLSPKQYTTYKPLQFILFKQSIINYTFYHGYWKDQRNAAVIILRYTMLRHNGLWEVIHI